MITAKKKVSLCCLFLAGFLSLGAQDFGFGFDGEEDGSGDGVSSLSLPPVKLGGEIEGELTFFTDDFSSRKKLGEARLGDIFSGSLGFSASGSMAEGEINLDVDPGLNGSALVSIGEAYLRAFLGPVDIEAGIRKLYWGKADSFGPLDLVNPLDYRDLSVLDDVSKLKIGRPMVHLSWALGDFSKLEGVFVPWHKGHQYALEGRWKPALISGLERSIRGHFAGIIGKQVVDGKISEPIALALGSQLEEYRESLNFFPDAGGLKYAEGGLRFTTTIGSSDLGIQYYYGRTTRPAYRIAIDGAALIKTGSPPEINFDSIDIEVDYNSFHHIGLDYARVVGGFNLRAEAAASVTSDLKGDRGDIYNPSLGWSLGFDRGILWGINGNIQANGIIRLLHHQISEDLLADTEAETNPTSTRITLVLSKKFFRDELEVKLMGLWDIEDRGFFMLPGVSWTREGLSLKLTAGFFGGDRKGELGQYGDNGFIRMVMGFRF